MKCGCSSTKCGCSSPDNSLTTTKCGCSNPNNSLAKEMVRLSPINEEEITLPYAFQWEPLENAYKYVIVIDEIRENRSVCVKEIKETQIQLEETDLEVNECYRWHLEALDSVGHTIATTRGGCGTPISTFLVQPSKPEFTSPTDQWILLDFSHNESNIQGLGVYGFSQYTAYSLLRKHVSKVGTNPDRKLSKALLSSYDVLMLHSKYAGPIDPFAPSEIEAITGYVTNGGTLFVLCWGSGGGADDPDFYNPVLENFGIELKPIPEPKFRKAENLDPEIFHDVNEIALQCPAEIVGKTYDVLGSAATGEHLLVKQGYGQGSVFVSGMGMAFQDSYMGRKDERAINNQRAFVNLMRSIC